MNTEKSIAEMTHIEYLEYCAQGLLRDIAAHKRFMDRGSPAIVMNASLALLRAQCDSIGSIRNQLQNYT